MRSIWWQSFTAGPSFSSRCSWMVGSDSSISDWPSISYNQPITAHDLSLRFTRPYDIWAYLSFGNCCCGGSFTGWTPNQRHRSTEEWPKMEAFTADTSMVGQEHKRNKWQMTQAHCGVRAFYPFDVSPVAWTFCPLKIANDGKTNGRQTRRTENTTSGRGEGETSWRRNHKRVIEKLKNLCYHRHRHVHLLTLNRLVVLESGLGLESGLKSVFAGLGLGLGL